MRKANKLSKALIVIGIIALVGISTTVAYFTGAAQSAENVFTTGTLAVEVNQDAPLNIPDVSPGDSYQLDFNVTNTGTNSVFIKGYVEGEWDKPELTTQTVSFEWLEVHYQELHYNIYQFGQAVGTEFLVTGPDQIGMLEIPAGETVNIRMSVKFSDSMDNEYQNAQLSLALHLAAKQTQPGSTWPSEF